MPSDKYDKLVSIFSDLDSLGLRYVLVGEDPCGLSRSIEGDVDVVFDLDSMGMLEPLITSIASKYGLELLQVFRHEINVFGTLFAWRLPNGNIEWLGLDCCVDYYRHGRLLMSAEDLLRDRLKKGDFFHPSPEMDFSYYLIKKILKGSISERQISFLKALFDKSSQDAVASYLLRSLRRTDVRELLSAFQVGAPDVVSQAVCKARLNLRSLFFWNPLVVFRNTLRMGYCFFHPNGLVVSIPKPLWNCAEQVSTQAKLLFRHVVITPSDKCNLLRCFWRRLHSTLVICLTEPGVKGTRCLVDIDFANTEFEDKQPVSQMVSAMFSFLRRRTAIRLDAWRRN